MPNPKVPVGPVVALVVVVVLGVLSTLPSASVRVPKLVGLRADVAAEHAIAGGLLFDVNVSRGGGVPGTVTGQHPRPGAFLQRRAVVRLDVTQGTRQINVPNVTQMPIEQARHALEQAGLRVGDVIYRRITGAEPGRVASTDPPAHEQVDAGTTVTLISALP